VVQASLFPVDISPGLVLSAVLPQLFPPRSLIFYVCSATILPQQLAIEDDHHLVTNSLIKLIITINLASLVMKLLAM
jgi:hypothetical protein